MHPTHRIYATKFRQLASRFQTFANNPGAGTRAENLVRIQASKEAAELLFTAFDQGCLPEIPGLADAVKWACADDTRDDGKCHLAPCPENVFRWLGSVLDPSKSTIWRNAADFAADPQRLNDHLLAAAVSAEHRHAFTCLALADMLGEVETVDDPVEDALPRQQVALYRFLKSKRHFVTYDTLAELDCGWRIAPPTDSAVQRALKKLQSALSNLAHGPQLEIKHTHRRAKLINAAP